MMSIQEIWCRKMSGRGGLGYRYPARGYGITSSNSKTRSEEHTSELQSH